ncbi:MAG TPA: hypothetical protein VJX73_04465 [Terracidiphilus sp.]|nr:hypothetical protein [Terracidiphilus sp.]
MRKPIKVALIAALPLEFACLLMAGSNIKGLPSDAGVLERFLYGVMGIMHWPAKILEPLLRLTGDSQLAFWVLIAFIFVIGYLDWAALIAAILYGVRFLMRSSASPHA